MEDSKQIIAIIGYGRSGSTLLSRILGQSEQAINIGEASRYLSNANMFARALPCGCGSPVDECPLWSEIGQPFSAGAQKIATAKLKNSRALGPNPRGWIRQLATDQPELTGGMGTFFKRVFDASGASTVIDASKHPAHAALIATCAGFPVHAIHLVRDPRAVIQSYAAPKQYLGRRSAWTAAMDWSRFNRAALRLAPLFSTFRTLRYEDFSAKPRATVEGLCNELQIQMPTGFQEENVVELSVQHSLAGNPDKLTNGRVEIRAKQSNKADTEQRFAAALFGAGLNSKLGY